MNNSAMVAIRVQDILETAKQVLNEIQNKRDYEIGKNIDRAKRELFKKSVNDEPGYLGRIWRSMWNKPEYKIRYVNEFSFEEAKRFLINEKTWLFGNTWSKLKHKFSVEETLEDIVASGENLNQVYYIPLDIYSAIAQKQQEICARMQENTHKI